MTKATVTFFDEPNSKSVSVLVHELAHHTQQVLRGQDAHGAGHNKHFRLVAEALIGIERSDDEFSLNDWWQEQGRKGTKAEEEGRWVTTRQGNRLFIGEDGVARTGPGGETIDSKDDTDSAPPVKIGKYSMDRSVEAVKVKVKKLEEQSRRIGAELSVLSEKRRHAKPKEQWALAEESLRLSTESQMIGFDIRTEIEAQHAVNLEGFLEESVKHRGLIQMQRALDTEMSSKIRRAGGDIDGKYGTLSQHQTYQIGKDGGDRDSIDDFQREWQETQRKIDDDIKVASERTSVNYYGDPVEVKKTGKTLPPVADEVNRLSSIEQGNAKKESEFMAEAEIGIKTDAGGLHGFLIDRKYKNHFHRGTGGIGKESGKVRSDYRSNRRDTEDFKFGIPSSAKADDRPIYGFLENSSRMKTKASSIHYGDVQIVLKDDVKGRASYTPGDSMDGGSSPAAVAAPVKFESEGWTTKVGLTNRDWVASGFGEFSPNYIEAQVHGGISLDDVKSIRIPQDAYNRLDMGVQSALEDSGIDFEIIPPSRSNFYNEDSVAERKN